MPIRIEKGHGMATRDEVEQALLDAIAEAVPTVTSESRARRVLDLAEAWAWINQPSQPHGGSSARGS